MRFKCGLALVLAALLPMPAAAQQSSEEAPLARRSLLLDGATAGDAVLAVGERGHVLKSVDDGMSWRQIIVPARVMLTAVAFLDAELGYIVGHDEVILRTRDGGETWERVHDAPEQEAPLLDVYAVDSMRAVAVGAYGAYLETGDGGSTWRRRGLEVAEAGGSEAPEPEDYHLNRIRPSPSGPWYIAAEAGMAYRSDDLGASWRRLPSPYDGSFFGVLPRSGGSVLLFGLLGHLFHSGDGGDHWRRIETGTRATLSDATVLRDGRVVVVGYSGSVLVGDADLVEVRPVQLDRRMSISSVIEASDGDLLLFGSRGIVRLPLDRLGGTRE